MDTKSEDRIQQEIFIHFNNKYCLPGQKDRGIIFHVPNQRIKATERMKLAAIGVLSGVSDLVIIFRGKTVYIEVKTLIGTQSKEQKEFCTRVQENGHSYWLVRSFTDFEKVMAVEWDIK